MGLKLHYGISSLTQGIQMLPKLFIQAEAALKESIFEGVKVVRYDQIKKESEIVLNLGDYIKLLDYFNRGYLNEVYKLIDDVFIKLAYSMPSVKDTVSMLLNMLNYLYINLSVIYRDIFDIEEVRIRFVDANTLSDMKAIVIGTINSMYAKCSEMNAKDYSDHIVNYIINEVRTCYHTKMTLYELANKLAMNYNYISGLFAKKTGITFQEYLLCYRLDKARELLLCGNYCMDEIAGKCGFYDSKYFGKAYKKRFNMTPVKYRNLFC